MATVEWTSLGECQCWAADVDRELKIRCLGVDVITCLGDPGSNAQHPRRYDSQVIARVFNGRL